MLSVEFNIPYVLKYQYNNPPPIKIKAKTPRITASLNNIGFPPLDQFLKIILNLNIKIQPLALDKPQSLGRRILIFLQKKSGHCSDRQYSQPNN